MSCSDSCPSFTSRNKKFSPTPDQLKLLTATTPGEMMGRQHYREVMHMFIAVFKQSSKFRAARPFTRLKDGIGQFSQEYQADHFAIVKNPDTNGWTAYQVKTNGWIMTSIEDGMPWNDAIQLIERQINWADPWP
jgi:hypothetical protein